MGDRAQTGVRIITENKTGAETLAEVVSEAKLRVAGLVPAERQALDLLVRGYSLVGIGGEMGVPLDEAARFKASIMRKLDATHTAEVIRLGIYAGVDEQS